MFFEILETTAALFSFIGIDGVRILSVYKEIQKQTDVLFRETIRCQVLNNSFTMESLILAQDER
jgi:hypothetical protein